jgi:phosphohistidine phosphatase SixA
MSARDPRAVVSRRSVGVRTARLAWILALALLTGGLFQASAEEAAAWAALRAGGHVALMRHADAPGGAGDPPGYRLDDCATQRNLSDRGREDAGAVGRRLQAEGVRIGRLLSSPWCRCVDTARLLGVGAVVVEPAFSNAFVLADQRADLTGRARQIIASWSGPETLLVVTHGANIQALTGYNPSSGEIVVLARGAELRELGRIAVPRR